MTSFKGRSSYANSDVNYGEILKLVTYLNNPKHILEIGILDGFSLINFEQSVDSSCEIKAYDLFDEFNGNHSNETHLNELFKNKNNIQIRYGNFYDLHTKFQNNKFDIIHIDIANNGNIYEYAINHYMPLLTETGLMILEGGSKERDNVDWMIKYDKPMIHPVITRFIGRYNITTIGNMPSITLIKNKNTNS